METTNEKRVLSVQEFKALPQRERDAIVAEAMGYVWRRGVIGNCRGLVPPDSEEARELPDPEGAVPVAIDYTRFVPRFTTDLNAAWQVVDRIKATPRPEAALPQARITVTVTDTADFAACGIEMWRGEYCYRQDETVPLAICIAFLLALGALSSGGE